MSELNRYYSQSVTSYASRSVLINLMIDGLEPALKMRDLDFFKTLPVQWDKAPAFGRVKNEVGRTHPHVAHQAWTSSDYQRSPSVPSHDPARVTRDSTFNARNPGAKLGKPDEYSFKSVALTRSGQPGFYDDCDSVRRARTKRRNSVSTYLPSRGVNNTPSFARSNNDQYQASRNSFHQVHGQKFQNNEKLLQSDALWDQNCNDINPVELHFSQDLTGGRGVGRRHSVTSLSSSFSAENFLFDQTSGYLQRHGSNSEQAQKRELLVPKPIRKGSYTDIDIGRNLENSDTWSQKKELDNSNNVQSFSNNEPQSGQNSSARKRRRASCSVISSKSNVETNNIVQQSDEGLQNLILALQRDINPQNFTPNAKVPEKSSAEFRNRIPIAKNSPSLWISDQNLLSGSQVVVRNTPLEHSGSHIAIHLPDSGACPVTPRQEPVKRAPSFKDTHISLVYSRDLKVDDSLEDVLKCAQTGLGTNISTGLFKNEKKHNLVNSQGHTKVKAQGHTNNKSENNSLTIKKEGQIEESSTQSKSKTASKSAHLNKLSSARYFNQNKAESVENKDSSEESKSEESSESDQDDISEEKGLTKHHRPSPGHENRDTNHRHSPEKEQCWIEVDRAEEINHTGGHEANGTCLTNSETSKTLSRGTNSFRLKSFGNGDIVVSKNGAREHCDKVGDHQEYLGSETLSVDNDNIQSGSRNNSIKGNYSGCSEGKTRNTPFDKRPVKFEPRGSALGCDRPRSYSLDTGIRGLVRPDCVAYEDGSSLGSDSSDIEPNSIDSESSDESVEQKQDLTESSPKVTEKKKSSVFSKLKRNLTAPEGLLKLWKKPVRKNSRPSTSDIYTISEEISAEGASIAQEENQKTKLHSVHRKSVGDEVQLDEAFESFAETAKRRQELGEKSAAVLQDSEGDPKSSVSLKKERSRLRRKSLYDAPDIFERLVSAVDEAGDIKSQESVFSADTTTTSDSVFERRKSDDISSTGETDNEESATSSEEESEEGTENCFFNRFSAARTSVRHASIDFGCLDQVNRSQKDKLFESITVSASFCDNEGSTGRLKRRGSDGRIMGYAMAQNQSSQNSMQTKMVAEARSNSDTMRNYLKEYQSKFGQLLPDQDSDHSVSKVNGGKSMGRSDSDSSAFSSGDTPQPSRTAHVLANPSIRRYLLKSQARPSSRPVSRSSSPALSDSGPQSPKSKNLLSKTEFFFSSSENSPNDSPRGSVTEYSGDSLKRSFRKDSHDTGLVKSLLHQRCSSSELNLDQIGFLEPGKVETSKSGRSLTDPFPERSRSPREILELSQRSYSEASDNPPDKASKHYSDQTFQDIMKRSSLKSKFHIPTFEEFKLKKKTTFSSTLDYIGKSHTKQSKSSSHQPIKGVHSKLLVEQVRHARSMTALHELDQESEEDERICSKEGASSKRKQTILKASADANISLADVRPKEQNLNENKACFVQNSGCGTLDDGSVLKVPPRRRHRSSDDRKTDEGLSPRPKSMYVDQEVELDLRRAGSEQMLASESSYTGAESQSISVRHKTQSAREGSLKVPGVTVTESDLDGCATPKRPDRRQRKKSKSMIDLSKTDLEALQQAHQGRIDLQNRLDSCGRSNSVRATTKTHHHMPRSESSDCDLDQSLGHKEKHKRHKSGVRVSKTKSEPVPLELIKPEDGHRRSKSEKARRHKESRGKRHQTDSGVLVGDSVDGSVDGMDVASHRNSQHLKLDVSANYDSSGLVPSPRCDEELVSPRARKIKSRKLHKSSAMSSEDLAKQESSVLDSTKKLLKAHSMDHLNVLKKHSKPDKEKKVKGQRPISMSIPSNVDFEDEAIGPEVAPHVRRSDHGDEHRYDTEGKSMVTRSTSDITDARKEEKRRQKNKKIRSSKSDPFDEKGRRSQQKLREAHSHQQLVPDSSDTHFLKSSHSFQSIGDMDEDDNSSEVPVKRSSARKPKKTSNVSTTSVDSGVIGHDGSHDNDELSPHKDGTFIIDVERVDSGVGSETKYMNKKERNQRKGLVCVDCDKPILENDDIITEVATICKKCLSRRTERKETIQEIIKTEVSYGRDLKIIKEEFFKPMQNTSLLTPEQTQAVFLNFLDLMDINDKFADFLQDAIENANEQGDEDYRTVQIGKIFLDFSFMFIAFENYCVNQSSASLLLEQMEKERELLRIFLQVSQRDNQLLRRMNLKSFLMVPVQRIVKYPLLLTRLYKSTPQHNTDRELIKEAQLKIEEILDHINASAKGGSSGTRARTKGSIMRRGTPGAAAESVEIQKVAFETIGQNRNDAFCVMMGRLSYATPTDHTHWNKKGKGLKFSPLQAVVLALGKNKSEYSVEEDLLLFPKKSYTSEALMVLLKEKNGKYIPAREPLSLDKCVVSMDSDFEEVFEVHEINKDSLFFKADETKDNVTWVRHLKYQAKDVGAWRRRRAALANIMLTPPIAI